jgi:hypothetical protein
MFVFFITAYGFIDVSKLMTLWRPYYGMRALIKIACAIVSAGTAVTIWPLIPHAVARRSCSQLRRANSCLQAEIVQCVEPSRRGRV